MLRLDRCDGGEDQSSVAREEPSAGCSHLAFRRGRTDLVLNFRRGGKIQRDLWVLGGSVKNGDVDGIWRWRCEGRRRLRYRQQRKSMKELLGWLEDE